MGGCGDGDRGSSNSSGLSFRFKPYGYGDALPSFCTSGNQVLNYTFQFAIFKLRYCNVSLGSFICNNALILV